MKTVQASEAKTHFLRLLDEVEQGESLVITRHGKAVARVTPEPDLDQERARAAMERIRELRKRLPKPHVTNEEILEWIREGRE